MRENIYTTICLKDLKEEKGILLSMLNCEGETIIRSDSYKWDPKKEVPNIWRYESLLPTFPKRISLGEGLTPLRKIGDTILKLESYNPTGSYADRASAIIASYVMSGYYKGKLTIKYEKDFSYSLAYYLKGLNPIEIVIEYPALVEEAEILSLAELGATFSFEMRKENLVYENSLTIEGLKTIVFELAERKIKADKIYVPSERGVLALSIWKGLKDLSEIGIELNMEVIAVFPKGVSVPEQILRHKEIKVRHIDEKSMVEALIELVKRRIKAKLLSAAAYASAEEGGGGIAIITAKKDRPAFLQYREESELKNRIRNVLKGEKPLTAYEIWEALEKAYSLRGVYKALSSMEKSGEVVSKFEMISGKRKKLYSINYG